MRIISYLMILLVLMGMISPLMASANEIKNTNEIKINQNIQDNINLIYNRIELGLSPFINPDVETGEYSDETKEILSEKNEINFDESRAKLLIEKWGKKQDSLWKNLPQGKFIINASAYTAAADECGKSDGITASGLKVKEKNTIACPPQFPFGAKIKIADMGTYVCEDRGGAIKGNKIDIYMHTKKEAFAFGRKNLEAEIIL